MDKLTHPENDGSDYRTAYTEEVLKDAYKAMRMARIQKFLKQIGKGAIYAFATNGGMTDFSPDKSKNHE